MTEQSNSIEKLAPALVSALAEMKPVHRDGENPHFRSKYATLESVLAVAKPALANHKLAIMQAPTAFDGRTVSITTTILHESGEYIRSSFTMPVIKSDPQGVGSAITYGCRYAAMATLGLAPTDDDGEQAMDRGDDMFRRIADRLVAEINNIGTDELLTKLSNSANFKASIRDLPSEMQNEVKAAGTARRAILTAQKAAQA